MVLINNLTIDEINAALLHLQRARTEVVGGTKGSTVQNITMSNKGGGSTVDYAPTITALSNRIDKNTDDIESVEDEIDKIQETLEQLSDNGISSMTFDPISRQLQINTQDGEVYSCNITSENITLNFDATTNKLTLYMGEQTQEVTLPYINANEKGSANGVATLDSSGRVPYSQLPESAMEFLGQWNASTNTPHLADGTGTNGDFYICNVGGTVTFGTGNTQTFVPNDRVIYNGATSQWIKLPAGQVSSVNGMSGDVTLTASDINYSTGVTIKDKIDANAPVQADWTQSNSSAKDFIKNKIPIWITSGSADDNMSPVNVVQAGNTRPVTSNAVFDKIASLDVSSVGGSGKYIEAISETDGKISATVQNIADTVTANNMQSVTSNAVYNALLSHPIRVWATVQTIYYTLPVNIPKSFFTTGRTYIISLSGSYSSAYSGLFIFYNGGGHSRTFTVDKTSATVNDLSVTSDYVTISFNQAAGIGADSVRVDVIML